MGVSEKPHQMDGRVVDSEKWVVAGIPLKSQLRPILTKSSNQKRDVVAEGEEIEEGYFCKTPTSQDSRIPRVLLCPPAPKKRKPVSSKYNYGRAKDFCKYPEMESLEMLQSIFRPRV